MIDQRGHLVRGAAQTDGVDMRNTLMPASGSMAGTGVGVRW